MRGKTHNFSLFHLNTAGWWKLLIPGKLNHSVFSKGKKRNVENLNEGEVVSAFNI